MPTYANKRIVLKHFFHIHVPSIANMSWKKSHTLIVLKSPQKSNFCILFKLFSFNSRVLHFSATSFPICPHKVLPIGAHFTLLPTLWRRRDAQQKKVSKLLRPPKESFLPTVHPPPPICISQNTFRYQNLVAPSCR